jgi:hypothetical protein
MNPDVCVTLNCSPAAIITPLIDTGLDVDLLIKLIDKQPLSTLLPIAIVYESFIVDLSSIML